MPLAGMLGPFLGGARSNEESQMGKSFSSVPGHSVLPPPLPLPLTPRAREVLELRPEDIEVIDEFAASLPVVTTPAWRPVSVSRGFVLATGVAVLALNAALTVVIVRAMLAGPSLGGRAAALEKAVIAPAALVVKPATQAVTPPVPPAQAQAVPSAATLGSAPATKVQPAAEVAVRRPAKRRSRVEPRFAAPPTPAVTPSADEEPEPQMQAPAAAEAAPPTAEPSPAAPTEAAAFSTGKVPTSEAGTADPVREAAPKEVAREAAPSEPREAAPAEPPREAAPAEKPQPPPP
jgi:hypothetical protein